MQRDGLVASLDVPTLVEAATVHAEDVRKETARAQSARQADWNHQFRTWSDRLWAANKLLAQPRATARFNAEDMAVDWRRIWCPALDSSRRHVDDWRSLVGDREPFICFVAQDWFRRCLAFMDAVMLASTAGVLMNLRSCCVVMIGGCASTLICGVKPPCLETGSPLICATVCGRGARLVSLKAKATLALLVWPPRRYGPGIIDCWRVFRLVQIRNSVGARVHRSYEVLLIGCLSIRTGAEQDLSKAFDRVDHAALRAAFDDMQLFAHVIGGIA